MKKHVIETYFGCVTLIFIGFETFLSWIAPKLMLFIIKWVSIARFARHFLSSIRLPFTFNQCLRPTSPLPNPDPSNLHPQEQLK
jgi:hypothetical protein